MELLILNSKGRWRRKQKSLEIGTLRYYFCMRIYYSIQLHGFFISNTFISNTMLKLAKNQAKFKQHPEPELLLTENYSFSSHFVIRNIFYINVGFIGLKPPTYFSQNVLSISCNIFKVIKVTSYSPCFIRF